VQYSCTLPLPLLTASRPVMFEHLNDVLSHASSHSVLLVERAVVGLIKICSVLAQKVSIYWSTHPGVITFAVVNA
jgi:golgi-specific brefeldin A-resistance guanine nucleotide exchange factor 1